MSRPFLEKPGDAQAAAAEAEQGVEFVQRRVEEADGGRVAFEGLEDADEVFLLVRQQLGERGFAGLDVVGEDHLAHGVNAIALEEQVLDAGQPDALGAERDGGNKRPCRAKQAVPACM
jgi:hypothetical protein